jgi:hypothetical protein
MPEIHHRTAGKSTIRLKEPPTPLKLTADHVLYRTPQQVGNPKFPRMSNLSP